MKDIGNAFRFIASHLDIDLWPYGFENALTTKKNHTLRTLHIDLDERRRVKFLKQRIKRYRCNILLVSNSIRNLSVVLSNKAVCSPAAIRDLQSGKSNFIRNGRGQYTDIRKLAIIRNP